METTPKEDKKQQGIDIHAALDILSARSSSNKDHPNKENSSSVIGCGCCALSSDGNNNNENSNNNSNNNNNKTKTLEEDINVLKSMGQCIPLYGTTTKDNNDQVQQQQQQQQQQQAMQTNMEKIKNELVTMSIPELLQSILKIQQDRVCIYQTYDTGLEKLLKESNNHTSSTNSTTDRNTIIGTNYPILCANVTASFAVLSNTITFIRTILETKVKQDVDEKEDPLKKQSRRLTTYIHYIQTLQGHEKEKLNFTAALHLEKIRTTVASLEKETNNNPVIHQLYKESIVSLHQKINTCIEHINDVLEEIRYSIVEEKEEE